MATAITLLKATPYSLTYGIAGDGAMGSCTPQNDAVPGPLRTLLRKLATANAMATLNLSDAAITASRRVRIRHVEGSTVAQVTPATRTVTWVAAALQITTPAVSVSQIEIRLAQSVER
jgi:hypothetical protein